MQRNRNRSGDSTMSQWHMPTALTLLVLTTTVLTRSATSILTPLWIDGLNNNTNGEGSSCNQTISDRDIDPFAILFIVNTLSVVFLGLVLLVTRILCPYLITEEDKQYDKRQFALIGIADTVSAICFLFASSGCRTAPYLQSLAANFAIPVTFIIRYLLLGKRPTCRKTVCAVLVLFAEITAIMPGIYPGLEGEQARKDNGGAPGIAGLLWPLCFFFGFVPLALLGVVMEKAVKSSFTGRRPNSVNNINIAYMLFWSYFFGLLTLLLLFWTDFLPGFGTHDSILSFVKGFWFNIQCYFGHEGCHGLVVIFAAVCTVLLLVNRVVNSYFLRYLEGANYLVIINSIQTPLVFLFFTLFDENPLKWHPHAYLTTWLSITALCIMLPAVYIYDTGPPEVGPSNDYQQCPDEDGYPDHTLNNNNTAAFASDSDERTPLIPDRPHHISDTVSFVNRASPVVYQGSFSSVQDISLQQRENARSYSWTDGENQRYPYQREDQEIQYNGYNGDSERQPQGGAGNQGEGEGGDTQIAGFQHHM